MSSKFETRGVEFQLRARTPEWAQSSFDYSCDVCGSHGMRIRCEACEIRQVHKMVMAAFATEKQSSAAAGSSNQRKQKSKYPQKGSHQFGVQELNQMIDQIEK